MLNRFQIHHCFLLICLSICFIIVIPDLLKQGMFMDGQQYACVAKNLANDKGTFWKPFLSESWLMQNRNEFLEQPPLFYFIESFAFKVLGEHYLTEKLFSLIVFLIHLFIIHLIWKNITNENDSKQSWLPIFCFTLIPIVGWVFQNNMLEELLSVFTLLSVLFILNAMQKYKWQLFYLSCSGICVFLATLTKGLPGFFPIVFPLFYYLSVKKISIRKMVISISILLLIPFLSYTVLLITNNEAFDSLFFYVEKRLLNRITNQPSTDYRFFTLVGLFQELIPLGILLMLFFILSNRNNLKTEAIHKYKKQALLFFLIGFSASLPLMLTLVQNKFYFFPALPFFAIAISFLILPYLNGLLQKINLKKYTYKFIFISVVFFLCSCAYCVAQIGKFNRDETILKDVNKIVQVVGKNKNILVEEEVYYQWNFQFYLLRFGDISIEHSGKNLDFYLTNKNHFLKNDRYKKMNIELTNYEMYKLTEK